MSRLVACQNIFAFCPEESVHAGSSKLSGCCQAHIGKDIVSTYRGKHVTATDKLFFFFFYIMNPRLGS